jgi:acetylornithine deacetylase/succinyl-diaminopimelate desuccinylase-like protein
VPADRREWSRDPFGGELVDGEVWGRGALDMKGHAAANAVALASLAREGWRPRGRVLLIAAADEEADSSPERTPVGLQWLVEAHPEATRCDHALNEGGGDRVVVAGQPLWLCAAAEKMVAPFRLRVRGRSGHASMPALADNALLRAARLVQALAAIRPEPSLIPEVEGFFRAATGEAPPAAKALARARELGPFVADVVEPLLAFTLAPTMIVASDKRNVIPGTTNVVVDCRLLPEQRPEDVEALVRAALGEHGYALEWIERWGGTRSPLDTPLWRALESFVAAVDEGARLAPACCPGFTDSHWLREAHGAVAYGFFPVRAMAPELAARLVHSADERIAVDDLALGVDCLRHVLRELLA